MGGTTVTDNATVVASRATVAFAATVLSSCPEPPKPEIVLYIPYSFISMCVFLFQPLGYIPGQQKHTR